MKITRLSIDVVNFNLSSPYAIAYETINSCSNIFLKIETDSSIVGLGCAAPDIEITNESVETVRNAFYSIIEPSLLGESPFYYGLLLENLKESLINQPSALAMVDIALFDILSKQAQLPLYQFLGGYRKSILTSITIGILDTPDTIACAIKYKKQLFKSIKLKGGLNVDSDIERTIKVREAIGPNISIRFDANQGYSAKDAVRFINETKKAHLELFEQPTQKDNQSLLKQVTHQVTVPVMADESLLTLNDVFELSQNECTDMINIKLMKSGGISESTHINSVARAAKIKSMVGCMDESALSISAALHFALSKPNVLYADLDGHLDIVNDPFSKSVLLHEGILYPSGNAGIT